MVIYIGKARSLKGRVKSYFLPNPDLKVRTILEETEDIDYILTGSEREAAFLENNFIRQHKPKYNIRLKDDKSFPYLKFTVQEQFPGIYLTRKVEKDEARYFGPFSPVHQARKTIHLMNKYFGIRGCEESVPGKRQRPCLEYDLELCSAPCVGLISESEYRVRVQNSLLFLEGKVDKLLSLLKKKMKEDASRQEFEQAARWRDLIQTLDQIKVKPALISIKGENKDIVGFARNKESAALYVFQMRGGRVVESEETYFQANAEATDKEILSSRLLQFYTGRETLPEKILLPFEPIDQSRFIKKLSSQGRRKISIIVPQAEKDRKLVELAGKNAEMLLGKKAEKLSPLKKAKEILELKKIPNRIEGFDVSNTGGDESVASLVVFTDGHPQKSDYRKYKIKTVSGPNDIASLQEVLQRRYTRIIQEHKPLPDLIFMDGGKGQLNAARQTLEEIGLGKLSVVSLAKKEEILFTPHHRQGLKLEKNSAVLQLFQNIRDEAHRYAIAFHRQRRTKKSFASLLDGISGVGTKRKLDVLARYKSIESIKKAPFEELCAIVGKKAAHLLVKHLKSSKLN